VTQVDPARKGINSAECNNSTPAFIKIQKRARKVNLFIVVSFIYNLVNNAASSSAASNGKTIYE